MRKIISLMVALIFVASSMSATVILEGDRSVPVEAQNGMVVTSHYLATNEALKVLEKGGNAIDAAVSNSSICTCGNPTKIRQYWWWGIHVRSLTRRQAKLMLLIIEKKHRVPRIKICFWIKKETSIKCCQDFPISQQVFQEQLPA